MDQCLGSTRPRSQRAMVSAFTLIELMVVIVLMGIAGAMIIPALGDTGVLRVQGAVRMLVADISFAQADAAAFQETRAIVFNVPNSSYSLVSVPGTTIDAASNTLYEPTRPGGRYTADFRNQQFGFGDARIVSASFTSTGGGAGGTNLLFDGLGGLISGPGSNVPGAGGTIRINGARQSFVITVEAFTGRTTVAQDRSFVSTP